MHLDEPPSLFCDLTQSYAEHGGGIGTYIRRKRAFIAAETPHRHLLIVPGPRDEITIDGPLVTARIASPRVPRSPQYRLLLRNRAVKAMLRDHAPDLIECQDAYNLPWAALAHRDERPETVLVGAYCTDFPTAYVRRFGAPYVGDTIARGAQALCYRYCGNLYRRFDGLYAMSEAGGTDRVRRHSGRRIPILPLGIDLDLFTPTARDAAVRAAYGVAPEAPLLVYAGRLDKEKRCATVLEAFERLPDRLGAVLVMAGAGNLAERLIARSRGLRVHFPGFIAGRAELAALLASSDIYVSGMADETFGLSVVEAQAAGLPVVGVAAGAMIERVPPGLGRLGPVDDADAMAANIRAVWAEGARAIGAAARAHVAERFSWHRTFERLFGDIYPRARSRRAAVLRSSAAAGADRRAAVTSEQ